MNETVKAALLAERRDALSEVRNSANGISLYRERLADKERWHAREVARLADIELHLRDNGVDLAAVDAEAEKARPKPSALSTGLGQGYANALGSLIGVNQYANYNPTAGLAKALDEA